MGWDGMGWDGVRGGVGWEEGWDEVEWGQICKNYFVYSVAS